MFPSLTGVNRLTIVGAFALLSVQPFRANAAEALQFNRDIRPILSENCFACHGHDKNQRKAKLRLDVRDVAIEKEAIVPGKPEQSKLVEHIFATDPDEIMPPPKSRKSLTAAQKEVLKQWIKEGAQYEPHWAYIPPKRATVPQPKNVAWVKNPVDAFIAAGLEAKKIQPSREADKATLLRRLSLDLIGLPPTPEEVAAYLKDTSPKAYERQVDRLLASPHYGERMAVPWLDLVRFADTVGYHGDQNQRIFPYRDYVINAFNRNKPFDEFTIEQIAGDMMSNRTPETLVASGFNRLNMMTREGGAQPKEYLAKYAGDRVRTVSMTWMGSTMGCAECHDHKYDPFTSKDFYQMEAFFADLKQWGVYMDYGYTPNPDLRGYSNDHPFPPEIEVESPYLTQRIEKLRKSAREVETTAAAELKKQPENVAAFESWRKQSLTFLKAWPTGWASPEPVVDVRMKDTNSVAETNFTVVTDGRITFSDKAKESTKISLSLSNVWVSAIRLEIVPQEVGEASGAARKKKNGTAITLAAAIKKAEGKDKKLSFYFAEADHKKERYVNGAPVIGVKDLWQISTEHGTQSAVWLLEEPVEVKAGESLVVNLGNLAVASARVAVTPFVGEQPLDCGIGAPLQKALERNSHRGEDGALLARTYLLSTHWNKSALAKDRELQASIRECRNGKAWSMISEAREPLVTRVLARGNWQDESGEVVQPGCRTF